MAEHTPGPWKRTSDKWAVIVAEGRYISIEGRTEDEVYANTALVSAAPELLAALKAVTFCADVGNGVFRNLTEENAERALAAIAKAEGR
jgi:hypothetical protein